MHFSRKKDTDINKNISKFKKSNKVYFIIGIFIIIFIISLILIFTNNTEYYIDLLGEEYIKIYEGSEYIEDANGYYAYDSNGNDLTNEVIIDSDLDTNTIGEYTITYSIMDISKERYISVIEKPNIATYIHLKGDEVVYLSVNEEYIDPGYTAIDTFDSNLTKKVKVTNNIDNTKAGIYKVTYSVTNSSGVTSSAVRKVIVMDSEVSLSLSNTNPTNSSVSIDIHIEDNYYSYLILPNGEKITNKDYSYKINSNGEYKFIIYNTKGKSVTKSISVTNIDKEAPTGSCSGTYGGGKSNIVINASDNNEISKYIIDDNSYKDNNITIDKDMSSVSITLYDNAGNSNIISCNLERISINPSTYYVYSDYKDYTTTDSIVSIGESTFVYTNNAGRSYNVYSQRDSAWGNVVIGTRKDGTNKTLTSSGCGPTTWAAILSGYGYIVKPQYSQIVKNSLTKSGKLHKIETWWGGTSNNSELTSRYGTTSIKEAMIKHLSNGDPIYFCDSGDRHIFGLIDVKEVDGVYLVYGMNTWGQRNEDEVLKYLPSGYPSLWSGWFKLDDILSNIGYTEWWYEK